MTGFECITVGWYELTFMNYSNIFHSILFLQETPTKMVGHLPSMPWSTLQNGFTTPTPKILEIPSPKCDPGAKGSRVKGDTIWIWVEVWSHFTNLQIPDLKWPIIHLDTTWNHGTHVFSRKNTAPWCISCFRRAPVLKRRENSMNQCTGVGWLVLQRSLTSLSVTILGPWILLCTRVLLHLLYTRFPASLGWPATCASESWILYAVQCKSIFQIRINLRKVLQSCPDRSYGC